jgi:site-specific DNA-cytosine methylase
VDAVTRYLSVCSGIESASVAWEPLGWTPLAFSEVATFPRKVLAHRFPHVPLHGDFTVLRDQPWIAGADVLVGGTPCQSFSVAGLRGGLSDERGNLTLEFVRLANAIDDLRPATDPARILWENVPGVLSSRDNAFGAFLAGLAGCDAALTVNGTWPGAGVVAGPRRVVAWRVLDAQFFGVPQSRRRVFVLSRGRAAPCGGWGVADALLPIQQSNRGNPPQVATPWSECGEVDAGLACGVGRIAQCITKGYGSRLDTDTEAMVDDGVGLRHLTATEVERCFGFPDHWTDIPGASVAARWQALGNSMCVPVMAWIGQRIEATRCK